MFKTLNPSIAVRGCLSLIGLGLIWLGGCGKPSAGDPNGNAGGGKGELVVYCAAGIRKPVEELARRYEEEMGVSVRLDYGSSGEMEGKLQLDRDNGVSRADLYIPADTFFARRAQGKGLTQESVPLAEFRLVLAVAPGAGLDLKSINDLLEQKIPFAICEEHAGVGKKTKAVLDLLGKWQAVKAAKRTAFPRVPEAANAVKVAQNIKAAFVWDTTARQFGLTIVDVPELRTGEAGKLALANISGNVTSNTEEPTRALHFARYLSAPKKGGTIFQKHHFGPAAGDRWVDKPELRFACGGVNRKAVEETIRDFEKREGCTILVTYAGCGTLVGTMKAGQVGMPDAFFTCDASYMDIAQNDLNRPFATPSDVSSTAVVFLVRKGNPKGIQTLADLAKPGIELGTTDPKMSALGDLSHQMFRDAKVADAIRKNKTLTVTSPTAHELILQMEAHPKLDVVLVYEANVMNLRDKLDIIRIKHPRARAVQNIALARDCKYPQLASRLMDAIKSDASRRRFESRGFAWLAEGEGQ